jgi:hypothetical protein
MTDTTTNALTDFDLCLALAQTAINSQMHYAWAAWKRRTGFSDMITIKKIKKDGNLVDSKYGLANAKVAPLTVDLNVAGGKLGQVRVTLQLLSGSVDYYDEASDAPASYPISGTWSVSFLVDLDKKPVDLAVLATIDPLAQQIAQGVIKDSGLPDAVFSIEYLFMDLTKVDLLLEDNKNVNIPGSVPDSARTKALTCLNLMLQGDLGEFMLGTVVRRNNAQAVPTFALTDFIFDVHADRGSPQASTLSYLGMLAGRPRPNDSDAARLKLADGWISPKMIDGSQGLVSGIMAIGKSVFLEKYLIAWFTKTIGSGPGQQALTWSYSGGDAGNRTWTSSDIIDREWEQTVTWNVALQAVPGANSINLSGRVSSRALMDGYTKRVGSIGHFHTEWIHMEGYQDFHGAVTLTTKGIGTGFNVLPQLTYRFDDPVVTNNAVEGGAKVLTAFEQVFTGGSTAEKLRNLQANMVGHISGWLEHVFNNFSVALTQHAFIPPGGGVFTFQNCRFSLAGDLLFDVIYQAP